MGDALQDIFLVARIIGLHPGTQDVLAHFRTFVVFITLMCSIVSIFYTTYTVADFESVSAAVEATPIIYQALSKLYSFKFGVKKIGRLYGCLEDFVQLEELPGALKRKLTKERKVLRTLYLVYCTLVFISLLFYVLKPIFAPKRGFALNWYPPCDYSDDGCYVLVNCLQVFHAVVYFMTICVADGAFIILGFRVVEQFDILKHQLRALSQDLRPPADYLKRLYRVVDQHNVVLDFIKRLNNVYYLIALDQFWSTFVAVCMGLFLFTLEGFPPRLMTLFKYISFSGVLLVQLYIFCQVGEFIANECEGFGFEAYNLNWHQSPNKDIKNVTRRIIHTSNNALKMDIGKIFPLNLETFMLVVKNAVSFYALLQTVYAEPAK